MPRLVALTVHADAGAWREAGFEVGEDGACRVGSLRLDLSPPPDGGRTGVVGWAFAGLAAPGDLDGLPTATADLPADEPADHPVGATSLDHLVVATPDLARTIAAFEAGGLSVLRTRDTGTDDRPTRQVFLRPGEVVLEVVGPRQASGDGPARFWGLAFTVADLDDAARRLGPLLGAPKAAVQPGRRIATVRTDAGLGVPVALMTADGPA